MLLSYSNIWKKCCVCATINGSMCVSLCVCVGHDAMEVARDIVATITDPRSMVGPEVRKMESCTILFLVFIFFSAIFLGGVLQWSSITWPHCKTGGAKGGHLVWGSAQLAKGPSLLRSSPLDAWAEECVLLPASSHAQGVHHKTRLWPVSLGSWLTTLNSIPFDNSLFIAVKNPRFFEDHH